MASIVLYPSSITTTTGRSIKYATQMLSNPQNLTSDSENLAYWGTKTPIYLGNYLRNYPDSLTSRSGSFYTPEEFKAVGFNLNNIIPNEAIIKKISIEYAWEQISYSSSTGYGSFEEPTITLLKNNEKINTIKGIIPEKNRYNNNKTNPNKMNTNEATLQTIHSQNIYNSNETTIQLTGSDLKKINLKFTPTKNTSYNYLRIVMQFIRLKIEYENNALIHISSEINKKEFATNEEFNLKFIAKSSNNQYKQTKVKITIPDNIQIINYTTSDGGSFNKGTYEWIINDFEEENKESYLYLTVKSLKEGEKIFIGELLNNKDSINYKTSQTINIIKNNITFSLTTNKTIFEEKLNSTLNIKISLAKSSVFNDSNDDYILIDTDNLITSEKGYWKHNLSSNLITEEGNGIWKIKTKNLTNIILEGYTIMDKSGDYNIHGVYYNKVQNKEKSINILVLKEYDKKDFFTLKIEDGSDIKYNSLLFTEGDDLITPLTYDTAPYENILDYLLITGYEYRIPSNTAKMVFFTLKLDTEKLIEYKNILGTIDIYDENGNNRNDIIIQGNEYIDIFDIKNPKHFSIDSLSSNEEKKIGFIILSEKEDNFIFKINIFNEDKYDSIWKPVKIYCKNVPSVKLEINGINELNFKTEDESYFTLNYIIENKSNLDGENIKFKIIEPEYFMRFDNEIKINGKETDDDCVFIPSKSIWKFSKLSSNSKKYILSIPYKATKKGFFDFTLITYDDEETFDDDQYYNKYTHNLMVNINTNVNITTTVSNQTPEIDELFDYNITIENFTKPQKIFTFDIYDIGVYDNNHKKNDYDVENIICKYGKFYKNEENNNKIGTWVLENIGKNKTYSLSLSLNPKETDIHTIKCVFSDNNGQENIFYNKVEVRERNNRINFNVYHAVGDENQNCNNCNELTEICDDDFIPIGSDFYYVFKITNNERNDLTNLEVKARLNEDFLNNILCSSIEYIYDKENKILLFYIDEIKSCETKTFCIKIKPTKVGEYISSFVLISRNSNVLFKQLTMNVNLLFPEKKTEHEVIIYNFEKTNRYFRYEIDGSSNIYKFFNKKDKSKRLVDIEDNKISSIEKYRGNNLKEICRQINNSSKYVDAELLRIGNNNLENKGYELFPDGFIRRFGLLRSEIFHYTGQLPQISDLVDYAMRWDIDNWDRKVWTGNNYNNGVFDLTIDYSKIPKNFQILEETEPITTLQNLVEKTKPYGTKGICYYSNTTLLDLEIFTKLKDINIITNKKLSLDIEDLGLISLYNRYDNSLFINYDMIKYQINKIKLNSLKSLSKIKTKDDEKLETNISTNIKVYDKTIEKIYLSQCEDILNNILNSYEKDNFEITENIINQSSKIYINENNQYLIKKASNDLSSTLKNNIGEISQYNNERIIFNLESDHISDTSFGIYLTNGSNYITISRDKDELKNFNGFTFKIKDKIINKINFSKEIKNFEIGIHSILKNKYNIYYFTVSINSTKMYYIGYYKDFNYNYIKYGIFCTKEKEIDSDSIYTFNYMYNIEGENPLNFGINENINTISHKTDEIKTENKNWKNLTNLYKENKYLIINNKSNIDEKCSKELLNTSFLMTKFNNIDLQKTDEIQDISLFITAQSNKENFMDDLKISFLLDGDSYIPTNNISKKRFYPKNIRNLNEEYIPNMFLARDGITFCNNCLKTMQGYYDTCEYCGEDTVTHFSQKTDATYCHNCGWVSSGWSKEWINRIYQTDATYCNNCEKVSIGKKDKCEYCGSEYLTWYDYETDSVSTSKKNKKTLKTSSIENRCIHCLSDDIEYIKIDFNRTFCNDCHNIENDYYNACPKCFSSNISHLLYSGKSYSFYSNENNNLDNPIIVKTKDKKVKIGTLTVPLNNKTLELEELDKLELRIIGKNNNNGLFYYCPYCKNGGFGHPESCPYCNSEPDFINIENNIIINAIIKKGNTYSKLENFTSVLTSDFDISINIKEIAKENIYEEFSIFFYIENISQEKYIEEINNYDFPDNIKNKLLDTIPNTDIVINDFKIDSHYKNEEEWDIKFYSDDRTGIKYDVSLLENKTDYIEFSNFNFDSFKTKSLQHAWLYIDGINKSDSYTICEIIIKTTENTYNLNDYLKYDIFNYKYDLLTIIDNNELNNDLIIKIYFKNLKLNDSIVITNLNINIEYSNQNITYPILIDEINDYIKEDNNYLITSFDKNNWGLKKDLPGYLTGIQLLNNLVCLIDFGKLSPNEYIKLYDIQLVLSYKTKKADFSTEYIDSTEKPLQMITGDIIGKNELFGLIKDRFLSIDNLKTEIGYNKDIDTNFIKLNKEIYQSFTATQTNIAGIAINTLGRDGYPEDRIFIEIYDDKNNKPGNCLFTKEIDGWEKEENYIIDISLDDLEIGNKYWIGLIDENADENNYYKIKYNKNYNIGQLITKNTIENKIEDFVISFGVYSDIHITNYTDLPTDFSINEKNFKLKQTLFKYNTIQNNKIYIKNLKIKQGKDIYES